MALADPQSVTLSAAVSLPRITLDNMSGTFVSGDGVVDLRVSHYLPGNRKRSAVVIRRRKVATDPLSSLKSEEVASITVTIERNKVTAFTEAELIELISGVNTWFTAGTNANAKKILGLES